MNNIITFDNLRDFAYVNDRICSRPIRGIVLSFFGLNGRDMYAEDTPDGQYFAERGILYVVPYNNPWAWMNRQAVSYTDEILDVLFTQYDLPDALPVVSTGGSMGGLSALVYTMYAKRTPVACVANCPVCDLPYHFTERPDLPRTLYSAFWNYEGTMDEALRSASPLHLAERMPDAAYTLFHCTADKAVNKKMHSDRFVAEMKKHHRISYIEVPDHGHCDLPPEIRAQYLAVAADAILF